ncbi:putative ATP binding component of ABC-transporter [Collimonas arenae]|uniref:Putative ATP binding component of ABC-transporter n=1 Tax=Collimonas arenae TaxID=279058 RepID=A0A127QLW7_9BURK|nr:ABC transporter ATP-binding protein [Collimonas arenae]AMP01149.1 putative ATP binding component of ABC-transporter [Collimonas arenae]AMP11044.1 putative ATP binding component of ABC-transporter [Collimonas arenae]
MGKVNVKGLGKAYKSYGGRWSRLAEWVLPFAKPRHQLHWVLQDIDFELAAGEAVGIVGINGAGKSTLLKVIAGTSQASAGSVDIQGRVAALLELGMGFHADFTGRQNAFMAGQLQGLSSNEIEALMPAIEAFAEIGEYMDQPVRTYSSGMQMRLAFSVATASRPDVLIVDEALSVGDAYFQHKSFERIREFRRAGTTLLIVSHDRYAIQTICDRAILLNRGRLEMQGDPVEVMDYYNAMLAERERQTVRQERLPDGRLRTISGTGEASIVAVTLLDDDGRSLDVVEVGSHATLEIRVAINRPVERLVLGYMIKDKLGQSIFGINTHRLGMPQADLLPGEELVYRCRFPVNLGKGSYSVAISLSRLDSHLDTNYEWRDYSLIFHVVNTRHPDFVGCAFLDAVMQVERSQHQADSRIDGVTP